MPVINFILNIAGLLLWLNSRSGRFDPLANSTPATLVGTLRRAEPLRLKRWHLLFSLAALLFLRALFYWQVGPALDWTPSLKLGSISLALRSDFFLRALFFSLLSFLAAIAVFYLWILFLSIVNHRASDLDPLQKLVRVYLGWADRLPWPIKLVLPFFVMLLSWLALSPLLTQWRIIPPPASTLHRFEQAATLGLGAYLAWKYLVAGLLALYLLSSYVYLGPHPFWIFLNLTCRNILSPLRILPLRFGKLDFAPLVAIALIFVATEFADRGLTLLYSRLPLLPGPATNATLRF